MKKLSLLSLAFLATSFLTTAMGDDYDKIEYETKMAYSNTQQMLVMLRSQAESLDRPDVNSRAAALVMQNATLQQYCNNTLQLLGMLMAPNKPAAPVQAYPQSQLDDAAIRGQEVLQRVEREEAVHHIDLVLSKVAEQLAEILVLTETTGPQYDRCESPLTGEKLSNAIDQYVAHMNSAESSLANLLKDKNISQSQIDRATALLAQARHQSQAAKNNLP